MAQPTITDIEVEHNEASVLAFEGRTKWPGMTYEEGVSAALAWVLNDQEDKPLAD